MQPQNVYLDVRRIPQWQRHPRIFSAFAALLADQALVIVSDHEPRPLRAHFDRRYGKRYTWDQRRLSDDRWEVAIRKSASLSESDFSPLAVLRRCAIFANTGEAALEALSKSARRAAIKRHHAVVDRGVQWPYVGIVERGIVQAVLTNAQGREQALYDVLPDELFGETALLDGGLTPMRHVALTADTAVLLVAANEVRSLYAREPSVFQALSGLAAQRMRTVLERFSLQFSQSAAARLAHVLLPYADPAQGLSAALPPLPKMTHAELATSAGTVKEVASRALSVLEHAGAIEREGGHIVRLDRAKLTDIALS